MLVFFISPYPYCSPSLEFATLLFLGLVLRRVIAFCLALPCDCAFALKSLLPSPFPKLPGIVVVESRIGGRRPGCPCSSLPEVS